MTQQLIQAGFTAIANTVVSLDSQKKQSELNKHIAKLTIQQKTELEAKMIEAKTAIERQRLLFQSMAIDKNNHLIKQTSKDKRTSIIVLSSGIIVFGLLLFISRKRNG